MLHENMNIYRLMVHAQQVQEARFNKKSRDASRKRSNDGGFSKGRFYIQDNNRLKKGFLMEFLLIYLRLRPQKGKVIISPSMKLTC